MTDKFSKHKCGLINPQDKGFIPKCWCLDCNTVYFASDGEISTYQEYIEQFELDKNK